MKSNWNRNTLGNLSHPIPHPTNPNKPAFNNRCSFGNQHSSFLPSSNIPHLANTTSNPRTLYTSPNKTERKVEHIRTPEDMRFSRDVKDAMKSSGSTSGGYELQGKSHHQIDEIGNLLSDFKSKFASIQQKYSLKSKEFACRKGGVEGEGFCGCGGSENSGEERRVKEEGKGLEFNCKMFLKGQKYPNTVNFIKECSNTVTSDDEHHEFKIHKPSTIPHISTNHPATHHNITSLKYLHPEPTHPQQPQPSKPSLISKALQNKVSSFTSLTQKQKEKQKFRATFAPSQTKLIELPIRKIREAEEVIVKENRFRDCKNVESETESNQDEDSMKESIVISKFEGSWKGVKSAETEKCRSEKKGEWEEDGGEGGKEKEKERGEGLRRFKSVRVPFSHQ